MIEILINSFKIFHSRLNIRNLFGHLTYIVFPQYINNEKKYKKFEEFYH